MEAVLVDKVKSSLRHFMPRNAVFLAERLCAEFPTELNLQLLATCYLHNNQPFSARHIMKGKKLPESRYLFSLSCFRLNLLSEAEATLVATSEPNVEVPNGAAGHYLLGLIYRYTGRPVAATDHFIQALSTDPLLWAAYEELCSLGAADDTVTCFSDRAALSLQQQYQSMSNSEKSNIISESRFPFSEMSAILEEACPRQLNQLHGCNNVEVTGYHHAAGSTGLHTANNVAQFDTPSPVAQQASVIQPPPVCRNNQAYQNISSDSSIKSNLNPAIHPPPRRKFVDELNLRKVSGRLSFDSGPRSRRSARISKDTANPNSHVSACNGMIHPTAKLQGAPIPTSPSLMKTSMPLRSATVRKGQMSVETIDEDHPTTASCSPNVSEERCLDKDRCFRGLAHDSRLLSGIKDVLLLLRTIGEGYRLAASYRCQEAIEVFKKLPEKQFNTGWILSQVGKAYFELVDYKEADYFFELARQYSPCLLEGMDVYSTVLYHQKEETRLSFLAQELVSIDRLAPQTWCVVGNCYGLQKDHENALKCFQRAVQVDSRYPYAHTLCGHEYSAMEDYENSIKCYQGALKLDERHYNAWYGLGVVYLHLEKVEFAEHHFRKACDINDRSSILMCYLGMALHSLKRNDDALTFMESAVNADKHNPLPKYQKARILVSLERYDEALEELDQLRNIVPHEHSTYALMGRIYKQLNILDKAMFYYGIALDLKPPAADAASIKNQMEKVHLPDEMDEEP